MIICRCNEVTKQEIKDFIKQFPHASLKEVKEGTTASTNCGRCAKLVEKTFEKAKAEIPKDNQLRLSF